MKTHTSLRKLQKNTKNNPFEEVPTAPKCCKKHYEIKIFFSHDQNMTKNVPHAGRANHDQELTKTAKKHKQKHFQSMPTAAKCCKQKKAETIFSCGVMKKVRKRLKRSLCREVPTAQKYRKKTIQNEYVRFEIRKSIHASNASQMLTET